MTKLSLCFGKHNQSLLAHQTKITACSETSRSENCVSGAHRQPVGNRKIADTLIIRIHDANIIF
ncbi:MAG: hypothetical protein CMK07_16835 [Ponticaulis sp.]|nr:hypothetical protein [Ponticaulis sp.]